MQEGIIMRAIQELAKQSQRILFLLYHDFQIQIWNQRTWLKYQRRKEYALSGKLFIHPINMLRSHY